MSHIICPNCHKEIEDNQEACPFCGVVVRSAQQLSEPKHNLYKEEIEHKSKNYKAIFTFSLIFSIVMLVVGIGTLLAGIITGNIELCITAGIVSIALLMFFVYSLVMYLRIKHTPIEVTVEIEKEKKQANADPAEAVVTGAVEIVVDILSNL